LEKQGYVGLQYVRTDPVNDHHDQTVLFRPHAATAIQPKTTLSAGAAMPEHDPKVKAALMAAALEAAERGDHDKLDLLEKLAADPEMAQRIFDEATQVTTMSEEPTPDASASFLG
jgi:hypothetical protein